VKLYLWLLPSGQEALRLQQIISDLSRGFKQPTFPGHLTIWSGHASIEQGITWLQEHQSKRPISVQLLAPTFGNSYYQCVYLPVNPNEQLVSLHNSAGSFFKQNQPFFPHISILYGELGLARKRDVSISLEIPFPRLVLDQLALIKGGKDSSEWSIIHQVPLNSDSDWL
jgi:hypothetical protein